MRCHPLLRAHWLTLEPAHASGEDAPLEGEGLGIELEDGKAGEDVSVGVEGLVVEDARGRAGGAVLAGDELTAGEEEGLRGLAFDLGAQGLLAAVCVGQVGLVEGEEGRGEDGGKDDDGGDDAVETDAGGLHSSELGAAVETSSRR